MNSNERKSRTGRLLLAQLQAYPWLMAEDVFKYLHQSAFGCEHLVTDEASAKANIEREFELLTDTRMPLITPLDGDYSRVSLSWLSLGLKPQTLARLLCLSAKGEAQGAVLLEEKLAVAKALAAEGKLPFEESEFAERAGKWREMGYPAVRHSEEFRREYSPAYRVIENRYASLLPLFTEIDKLSCKDFLVVAIEGGSAAGKTTLAEALRQVYECNLFHMDDFFLQPHQRTAERLAEVGGNLDRERFSEEVLEALMRRDIVQYRPFDCSEQKLKEPIVIAPKKLTVVEGVYSMHPAFGKYYDLSVFLEITPENQKKRILLRNTPTVASRFFLEWIPLENNYFSKTDIKQRADLILPIDD